MDDFGDPRDPAPDDGQDIFLIPSSMQRRRRGWKREPWIIAAVIVVVLAAVGTGIWYWAGDDPGADLASTEAVGPGVISPDSGDTGAAAAVPEEPPLELPELDASDSVVRDVAVRLSEHPRWAAWLVNDDLIRRFVTSVANVAAGASPADQVEFMTPEGDFEVQRSEGGVYIDPVSYRRYDLLTATFASLDTRGTARLYRQLHPLFEDAHRELGFPEGTFDEAFARAVREIVAVEVPEGNVELVPEEGVFDYRDPRLESRSPAEKHVLRMGPENARLVQAKLRELSTALGFDPDLPDSS